ncbi:MAG: GspH/FimT family pseudopilin [Henriciella sp.]
MLRRSDPYRASERGMTIVEVLMVVFIIGLTAGIVTLSLPQRPTAEQAGAQAFARVLGEAQDQAILSGQPVGLKLTDDGYMLMQWRRDDWRRQGRPERLPSSLDIVLQTELPPRPETWPELVFDPSGVVQLADFQLRGRGVRFDISLDETGGVRLVER